MNPEQVKTDEEIMVLLAQALVETRRAKPDDRSEKARRYAVTITELEKVYAYFDTYVIREQGA